MASLRGSATRPLNRDPAFRASAMILRSAKLRLAPMDRASDNIDASIKHNKNMINDGDNVLSNRSCLDGKPAGGVVVSHLCGLIENLNSTPMVTRKPLKRFGKLKDEESLTLQERLCARRLQMTAHETQDARESVHQSRAQPEAKPPVPAAQQELQLESQENVQPCSGDVMAPPGAAGAAEAVEAAFHRLDEKLRSEAAMMETRKGLCSASTDPQVSSGIAIIPDESCPATAGATIPPSVLEAATSAASICNAQQVSLAPCPQPATCRGPMACQKAPTHAAVSTSSDKAAHQPYAVAQQPQEPCQPAGLMRPLMRTKTSERQLPPEAQAWSLEDCRSWASEQEWSSWAEVQAFTRTLEPTLAEAVRAGSLESNPVVAIGKKQAAAPAIAYVQLKLMELYGSKAWGTASIKATSLEGPQQRRRPFLAAFLKTAKEIIQRLAPQGCIRL
ncbi:hypothetical protein Vretimale_1623 [Volvox reticuliferus]|uniref:Uncharacterized protein n=1 Tax=Volvox reticuliferus TaxID=1737510 RepID=A0A8J4D4N4_9CHLO|nr:hypothetical protein Vretimale_1623 [Volvox reticuliferus]